MHARSGLQLHSGSLGATASSICRFTGESRQELLVPATVSRPGAKRRTVREYKPKAVAAHSRVRTDDRVQTNPAETIQHVSTETAWARTLVVVEGLSDQRAVLKAVPAQAC